MRRAPNLSPPVKHEGRCRTCGYVFPTLNFALELYSARPTVGSVGGWSGAMCASLHILIRLSPIRAAVVPGLP